MRPFSIPFLISAFLLLETARCCAQLGLADSIDCADPASIKAHQFNSSGDVSTGIVGDFVGGHDERRASQRIAGLNAAVEYVLHLTPDAPATIEIEERWGREHGVVGYLIFVDGVKTYLRTWEANGAGPVHYFVQIPPPTSDHVSIKFVNESNASFAISRIWVFADLQAFVQANHMETPFYLAPTVSLKWKNFDDDLAEVSKIKSSFGRHENSLPAFTVWIAYARKSDAEISAEIDDVFKIADALQIPAQISFDSWWANTPIGPDGKGGNWIDEKYQQVVWNETKRQMQLSVPNQWSNTPWLTMNDADLNAFKIKRLGAAITILRQKYHALREAGKGKVLLAINLDNEPIYWASGNAGLGPDLLWADFNPATVAAAKHDGVTLDPADGLSRDERFWLWKNLLHYNEMIGNCVVQNLGDEPMGEDAAHAGDLLRNNVYTQAMMMSQPRQQYPMLDPAYPAWEHAAPASVRVGGEWSGESAAETESVMHQIPLGRCAQTNAECGNHTDDIHGIAPAYALGLRYFALYNFPLDQMQIAANQLDDLSGNFPPFLHEPAFETHEFGSDAWKSAVQSSSNVTASLLGNTTAVVVHAINPDQPGVIEYSVKAPRNQFDGLAIEMSGRAFRYHEHDPAVNIRVQAGDPLREMGTIFDSEGMQNLFRIDLSSAARGKDRITVRIDLNATKLPADYQSWVAIDRVRFLTPWPDEVIRDLPPQDFSMRTARRQNLLVSWRADAEEEITKLPPAKQTEAQTLFDQGKYADVYSVAYRK